MKRILFFVISAIFAFTACDDKNEPTPEVQPVIDSIVSGAGYANDVYYSMANGVVKTQPRTDWDLAFATKGQSISIHINSGNKEELYLWKGGAIADFNLAATLDNNSKLYSNYDTTSWYDHSAFEKNISPAVSLDMGWGIYNMNTHDVTGDSVYILKLANGNMKKIAILKRYAADYSFEFKIADLALDAPATTVKVEPGKTSTMNFVYYSVANNTVFNREPDNTTWDFVFTKYYTSNPGYTVTGILTNEELESAKLAETDSAASYLDVPFVTKVSNIGYNWKSYNMANNVYDIVNPYYYIHASDGKYYRIKFLSFNMSTGVTVFEKKLLN